MDVIKQPDELYAVYDIDNQEFTHWDLEPERLARVVELSTDEELNLTTTGSSTGRWAGRDGHPLALTIRVRDAVHGAAAPDVHEMLLDAHADFLDAARRHFGLPTPSSGGGSVVLQLNTRLPAEPDVLAAEVAAGALSDDSVLALAVRYGTVAAFGQLAATLSVPYDAFIDAVDHVPQDSGTAALRRWAASRGAAALREAEAEESRRENEVRA